MATWGNSYIVSGMQARSFETEVAGRKLTATFSDLANQANGSVIVRYGGTTVLVTAVMGREDKDGMDYFPLTVDFEEKFYAAGRILGGRFMKREGKPSDEAILSGRLIDRTIRPLFDQRIRREVQVVATVLAIDEENDPSGLALIGASLALATSDIPWDGPASSVRIGRKRGTNELTINPSSKEASNNDFGMLLCGKGDKVLMIESESGEVSEDVYTEAFKLAVSEIKKIEEFQKKIIAEIGKQKQVINFIELDAKQLQLFAEVIEPRIGKVLFDTSSKKAEVYELQSEWVKMFAEAFPDTDTNPSLHHYEQFVDSLVHKEAIENNRRVDGRAMDKIRPLFAQAGGISPLLHGTGVFYRGETHVLSVLTLGGPKDAQLLDGMNVRGEKRFMHHYNFPPFSTGETGRMGGANRRMIGHGALAEKALEATLPNQEAFPYTIRIVSESTASNGSTSQASICASSLALMDAGVPITRPVAGIAMGLMTSESGYKILTDIQGPEDHYGDMDFKVAGTETGITAIQLDIKLGGIAPEILVEALGGAKKARLEILSVIKEAIAEPRKETSPVAPKVLRTNIKQDEIGGLIGPGGRVIQGLAAETGAEIEVDQEGVVTIVGKSGSAEKARDAIVAMFRVPVAGETHDGEVVKVMDFGIFVKIGPNQEGLVHVSEIAPYRVGDLAKYFKEGEVVPVVVREIDHMGRINLSIKARDPEFAKKKGIPEATGDFSPRPPHRR